MYDAGVLTVYSVTNGSVSGGLPSKSLTQKLQSYYGHSTVGIQRYYTAMQNAVKVDDAVDLPDHFRNITSADVVKLEDNLYYSIRQVQFINDGGVNVTRLSLERVGEHYE